jgi:hypothetical protein
MIIGVQLLCQGINLPSLVLYLHISSFKYIPNIPWDRPILIKKLNLILNLAYGRKFYQHKIGHIQISQTYFLKILLFQ